MREMATRIWSGETPSSFTRTRLQPGFVLAAIGSWQLRSFVQDRKVGRAAVETVAPRRRARSSAWIPQISRLARGARRAGARRWGALRFRIGLGHRFTDQPALGLLQSESRPLDPRQCRGDRVRDPEARREAHRASAGTSLFVVPLPRKGTMARCSLVGGTGRRPVRMASPPSPSLVIPFAATWNWSRGPTAESGRATKLPSRSATGRMCVRWHPQSAPGRSSATNAGTAMSFQDSESSVISTSP